MTQAMTERPRDSSAAATQLRLRRVGGMFTTLKVRKQQKAGDYSDPGRYTQPPGTQAYEWAGANPTALPGPRTQSPQADRPWRTLTPTRT